MAVSIEEYDVFISHAATKDAGVAAAICTALEDQELRCWLAPRDVPPGATWAATVVDAIPRSRLLLLLLSRAANRSQYVHREVERAVSGNQPILMVRLDGGGNQPILMVRLDGARAGKKLELFVASVQSYDTASRPLAEYLPQLVDTVTALLARQPRRIAPRRKARADSPSAAEARPAPSNEVKTMRVALLYKRRAQPDETLLNLLETRLTEAGHSVFIDRHMSIGVEWAKQITDEIRNADAVIPLLSAASVHSEMLAYEVEVAYQAAQEKPGKPRLFPVRVAFEGPLPQELAGKLEPLHYFLWHSPDDDDRLVDELLRALTSPPRVPPTPRGNLERDTGAVPLDSKFYVERPTDAEFQAAITRRNLIVLIKGARQMGKTSLLARGLKTAREARIQVVLTDLQKLTSADFDSLENFCLAIGDLLADQLDLDVYPQDVWKAGRGPNTNFERYLRREVLERVPGQLLWALDEVDRLFNCQFGSDVLALFRTWHNECALDESKPWSRLTLAIAYATEAHLFISDPNQSPFNVGTKLALEDFTREQVADLNRRHGSPLRDGAELNRFYQLVAGQPYLVRRALNVMVSHGTSIDEFASRADHDDGPLGDHLRRILVMLARDPRLCEVVRRVLRGQPCPDYDSFYRLRSAGIVSGESKDDVRPRCGIYATYLERQLQ